MSKKFQIEADNQDVVKARLYSGARGDDHTLYLQLNGEVVLSICSDGTGDLYDSDIAAVLGNKTHLTTVNK